MLKFLFLCFCVAAVTGNLTTYVFSDPGLEKMSADLSLCIRNIIQVISEYDHFLIDVALINVEEARVFHNLHGMKRVRFVTKSYPRLQSELFNRIYVIYCNNFNEFKTGMHDVMNDEYFNPLANFIIVIDNFRHLKRNITNFLVFHNIYNATVLAKRDYEIEYRIYSFDSPIQPCNHREEIIKIAHCSNYTGETYIFPRMESVRGCSFKFIGYNFFPLLNFDNQYEGTVQKVIRLFESYAGVKIDLIEFTKIDKFGRLVGNFTYTDVLDKLKRNEYEGAVGGYFIYLNAVKTFSFAYPLSIDYIVPVLRRADFFDIWHAFFHKGNITVILVLVLIGLYSVLGHFLSLFNPHKTDPSRNVLIVFGLFLNQTSLRKFKKGLAQTLLFCSLLFAIFIIPYTLQAFISSAKTHPIRGYEPKYLDEVIRNYKVVGPSDWPNEGVGKNRKHCESRMDCLKKVRDGNGKLHYFTLVEVELYEVYKWMMADEHCDLGLYKLNEPVDTLMRTIYFQRGSVLVKPFDRFYSRLMASGLITHHYREIVNREQMKCKQLMHRSATVATSVKDLKGPYTLLIVGTCLSVMFFVFECYMRKL